MTVIAKPKDAERIIGTGLTGGKAIVVHALIDRGTGAGPFLYCKPQTQADAVDFTTKVDVTCAPCKRKLKRELTHG